MLLKMKTILIEFDQALTNDQLESVSLLNAVADRMYVRPGSARHLKVFYAGVDREVVRRVLSVTLGDFRLVSQRREALPKDMEEVRQ